jgi:hypothetical protein
VTPTPQEPTYAVVMSRGHGRIERIIVESVNRTRYGCTVGGLTYLSYAIPRGEAPTDAQVAAVRRVVGQLLAEGRLVERVMLGTDRYLLPATAPVPRSRPRGLSARNAARNVAPQQALQCVACDLRWISEEYAPHRLCWSCGEPGQPARLVSAGRHRPAQERQ